METHTKHENARAHPYRTLTVMTLGSYIAMYALMYAMVDRVANVYYSLNQAYMAGLMTAPMVLLELVLMRRMYTNTRANIAIVTAAAAAFTTCLVLIRSQGGISDEQFLRSMIPHHASAILMCEQAPVHDPDIQALCRRITTSQQSEIDLMKAKLAALDD
ncbi:MAG: DUF305 domain-containing protein [Myxococcota bacterium]